MKQKTILSNDKPWITPEYKTLIARRQVAHVSGNRTLYNQLRNQINRLSESLRSEFYQKSVDKMCDSKNWWKTVKSLIGLKSKDPTVENFANNEYDGDTQKLACDVNEFFVSVSEDLDPLTEPTINSTPVPQEFIIPVEYTEKQLMNIKVSKAVGPDQIPNWILHDLAGIIAGPVCAIHNSSIREGYTPEIWRSADICPLPKVKPIANIRKDLRPISLTPILAKLLEHHPVRRMP